MVSASATLEACMIRVAQHCFGVDSERVAEVLPAPALAHVPLAPDAIAGLLHLRGRIVPVIDVRQRLGFVGIGGPGACLVIRLGEDWFGLLVDEVLDVAAFSTDRIERPTAEGGGPSTDAVAGVIAAEDRLVYLLDLERLVKPLARPRTSSLVRHGVSHGR